MIRDTLLLLRLYGRISNRMDKRVTFIITRVLIILALLVTGALTALVGIGVGALVSYVAPLVPYGVVPGLVVTGSFMLMIFSAVTGALNALFLSGDLERLMVAPVDPRAVFTAKQLNGIHVTYALLAAFVLPLLVLYGYALNMRAIYYVLCVLVLVGLPLLTRSVGALLVMVLARFLPARRINEIMTAFYSLIGVVFYVYFNLRNGGASQVALSARSDTQLSSFLSGLGGIPFPTMWVGQGLAQAGQGALAAALPSILVYLLITFGLFGFSIGVANWLYSGGVLNIAGASYGKRTADVRRSRLGRQSILLNMIIKDWLLRLRDPRLLTRLLSNAASALVATFGLFNGLNQPSRRGSSSGLELVRQSPFFSLLGSPGVPVAGLVMMTLMVLFFWLSTTSVSLERGQFALLKGAPVETRTFVRAKHLSIYLPYFVLATLIFVIGTLVFRLQPLWSAYYWLWLVVFGYGVIAFQLAMSTRWARLDWENPKQIGAGVGSFLAGIGTLILLLLNAGGGLAVVYLSGQQPAQTGLYMAAGLGILTAVTALITLLSNGFAIRAWNRLLEG